jgi:hypothetical protein
MKLLKYFIFLFIPLIVNGVPLNDPVAYYKFDNNYYDSSGNGNDAGALNTTFSNSIVKVGNYSVRFQGDNQAVGIPSSITLGNRFTLSLWVYSGSTTFYTLAANCDYGENKNGFQLQLNSYATTDGRIYFRNSNGTNTNDALTPINKFIPNQWNLITYSVNKTAGKCIIYYNGVKACTDSIIRNDFSTTTPFYLGRTANNQGDFVGYIDEFIIYTDTITPAQADSLYNFTYAIGGSSVPETHVLIPNSNVDIAHNQNFLVHQHANINEYVGQLRINANWDTIGVFSYTLLTGLDKLSISNTGMVSIIEDSTFSAYPSTYYSFKFKISDYPYWDTATAYIYIAPEDSCKFIDPLNGSKTDYTSWSSLHNNFLTGFYYLQNRATSCSLTTTVYINKDNVTIGAYGIGAYPIVNLYTTFYNSSTDKNLLMTFYINNRKGTMFRDIQITNRIYDAFRFDGFLNPVGKYTIIDNCILTGHRRVQFSLGDRLKVINNQIHDILSDGMLISGVDDIEVAYNSIYRINKGYNQWGERTNEMFYGDCIQIEPNATVGYTTNDDAWIHHNYLHKNDTNKACLLYGSWMGTGDLLMEWNKCEGNPDFSKSVVGFYFSWGSSGYRQDTAIIRYNTFKNIEMCFQLDCGSRLVEISYNTFSNIGYLGPIGKETDSILIYNNTFYDLGDPLTFSRWGPLNQMWYVFSSATNLKMKLRNNIITSFIKRPWVNAVGSVASDYNIWFRASPLSSDDWGITMGSHDTFVDPNFYNVETLKLREGSYAINSGISPLRNYSGSDFTIDLAQQALGSVASGARDKGAYEYLIPTVSYNPSPEVHFKFLNPQNRVVKPLSPQLKYLYPNKPR